MADDAWDLEVDRADLRRTRVVPAGLAGPPAGGVLLGVDVYGLSANNVTYAALGDRLRYWDFFPADDGWGRVPVWGFADVVASRNPDLPEGERVYGYLPMSTHLTVEPDRVRAGSFRDVAPHRSILPPAYNHYLRTAGDPSHDPAHEAEQLLLRPLFMLSFMLDDALGEVPAAVLSSASSKSAIGLAHLLAQRGVAVTGLTSPRNVAFVKGLGCYDRVAAYDGVGALAPGPIAFADLSGDGDLVASVHRHWGDDLLASAMAGFTHHAAAQVPSGLPGPRPEAFFAPDRIRQRTRDWGPEGFERRWARAWGGFVPTVARWLRVERSHGPAAVADVWRNLVDGEVDPRAGHVLSPR